MATAKRLGIIASHGSLDAAYPPLILATSAVALDMEAAIFFTFYGLEIVKKDKADKLKVAAIGNPAMPVKIPTLVGALPGMSAMATRMMNSWMDKAGTAKVSELLEVAIASGVRLIACQMTLDVLGIERDELIDGIEIGGAATFLDYVSEDAIALTF
jgi:peroxiredoxin family protein